MDATDLKEIFDGEWFLPGNTIALSGILSENQVSGKLTLKIFGEQYIGGQNPKNLKANGDRNHLIILGNVKFKNVVTLYNCMWRGTKPIGSKLFEFTYSIEMLFDGAHFEKEDDLCIKSVSTEFPYVGTWYDGWESDEKINKTHKEYPVYSQEVVKLNERLQLAFVDFINEHDPLNGHSIEIKYFKWVEFHYESEVSLEEATKDWYKFARLLEFTTRKKIRFRILDMNVNAKKLARHNSYFEQREHIRLRTIRNYSNKVERNKKPYIHQGQMLLSKWRMTKEELNDVIRWWFANEKLYPIYDYYLDSNNWFEDTPARLSNVMVNNRFLNLIQGLEAYHFQLNELYSATNEEFTKNRQLVSNLITDVSLKKWFEASVKFPKEFTLIDRLDGLIQRYNEILIGLFGSLKPLETFSIQAKEYRNVLSHGRLEETFLGEGLFKIYFIAQIILCISILESLKLNNVAILKVVKSNHDFQRSINEVLATIPTQN